MHKTREYLTEDVFSRLAKASTFSSKARQTRDEESPSWRCNESPVSGMLRSRSEAGLGAFQEFLDRQHLCEEERLQRLDLLEALTAPRLRPYISERSQRLAERKRQRQRLNETAGAEDRCSTRLDVGVESVADSVQAPSCGSNARASPMRPRGESPLDPECSFKPRINPDAAQRDPRGLDNLSTGDKKRCEAKNEKLRAALEAIEQKGQTFQPKVNEYNGVKGRIRLREDPHQYLERVERMRVERVKWREKEMKRQEAEELAGCTFKPKISATPSFVSRMAESHRALQALREKENQFNDHKPEWW